MDDVAIAGAGPAGAVAAAILAAAGLRVRLFDRARFPRPKLCGDTLNPGALSVLQRCFDTTSLIANSDAIDGMVLTGPGGVSVRGAYGTGITGRSITRHALDRWLLDRAVDAGAAVEEETVIRDAVMADGRVGGVMATVHRSSLRHPARIVIAADGRRSAIAIGRGLARQPDRPRRWAIGAYFSDVAGMTRFGEMHVRRSHYIGVAPLPGGVTNVCLVVPHDRGDLPLAKPADALNAVLAADPSLRGRFASARAVSPSVVLGPMAVDTAAAGEPGLLLAGDAAGFIDPMTGDGLHFALRGAELAAGVVRDAFDGRFEIDRAHLILAKRRQQAFEAKWRFNRALRSLVASPARVSAAAVAARLLPAAFATIIRYAGDCPPPHAGRSAADEQRDVRHLA
ncbi:MAG TPA: FAD-dependent monooxygenase [Vicinamibacterales bacterium]|nr:FAD-dependent monooxygenase [Vicinamibacterales bacterium]